MNHESAPWSRSDRVEGRTAASAPGREGRRTDQGRSRRVAALTGASHGIGRHVAVALARHGFAVFILHSDRSREQAGELKEQLRDCGATCDAIETDVARISDVQAAFERIIASVGRLDVVVTNAGFLRPQAVDEMDMGDLSRSLDATVRGTFVVWREAIRVLGPTGVIVNLSTTLLDEVLPGTAAFVAAKSAVEAGSVVLAEELQHSGIHVEVVRVPPDFPFEPARDGAQNALLRAPAPDRDVVGTIVALCARDEEID